MYLLIIFMPLISAIMAGFFGKYLGSLGSAKITTYGVLSSCFFSYLAFYEVGLLGSPCYITMFTWIESEIFFSNWGFLFDSLTVIMLVVVTSVSTLVHIYSIEYMSNDPHRSRFMAYLSLFTFFMLILVTADNFIQMFVGWEGVGLCSYLLINFWFTRIQANKAAIKAMLVNRVGDFGLALGIIVIFTCFKSVDYFTVFALVPLYSNEIINFLNNDFLIINLICLLLFVGAAGKSAQIGLHTWLPDAMEGPTPVSALIHAATMVTAGVFMIARCSPLFEASFNALSIIAILGSITAFFAATTGLLQNDLKKVIAYSTCSQLGYMIFACGLSNYSVGIFHLANHAFFKALLFLGAGSVIHAMADEQDIRRMGGLRRIIPFTYAMMFIGSLSLMGFPFLTGFYSKDLILELAYAKYTLSSHFAYWLGTLSAFLTAFYSIRLLYLTFLTKTNSYKQNILHAHDAPLIMAMPLLILSIGSIFIGYFTKDMIVGVGTDFWGNAIYTAPKNTILLDAEFLPPFIKLIPVIFSLTGAFTSFICYSVYSNTLYTWKLNNLGQIFYNFFNRKWFFDKIYNDIIVQYSLIFGYNTTYKTVDRGLIEIFGPFSLSHKLYNKGILLSKLQTGLFYHYALLMLITLAIFIFLFLPFGFNNEIIKNFLLELKLLVCLIIICFLIKPIHITNLKNKNPYSKYVNLKINNIPLRVKENTTILQACESVGISLPRFCYHEYLSIAGNCRMCLVQVEKSMKPVVSCSMPVMKDMKILTNTLVVKKARENILEMLLINHPLDCPICDQGGECDLQQNTLEYGSDRTRFFFKKRGVENFIFNPLIKTVMTRCFHCTRCVRYASEVAGTSILGTIGRGKVTEVSTFISNKFTSLFSGNISDLCPVGALTTNANAFSSRKWERTATNSIDILDGLGSNIIIDTVRNHVIRISSSYNSDINKYGISDKIRYSYDSLIKLRLTQIFKRDNDFYKVISWKEALNLIQEKISKLEGSEMGIIYGPFSDLKTIYNAKFFFNKLGSSNIGTEFNIKNCLKLNKKESYSSNIYINYNNLNKISTYTRQSIDFDSSFKLNTNISGLEKADFCLLIGINPDTEATALAPRLHLMNINKNVNLCSIGTTIYSNLLIDILGISINEILKNILQGKHRIIYNLIIKCNNPVFLIGSLLSVRSDSFILNKKIKNISNMLEKFQKNKRIFNIKKNIIISSSRKNNYNMDLFFSKQIMNIVNYSASITGGLELGIIPGKTSLYNDISIFNNKLLYLLDTSITTYSNKYNNSIKIYNNFNILLENKLTNNYEYKHNYSCDSKFLNISFKNLVTFLDTNIKPFVIYQGHHIIIENEYKPDLILPSAVYTEKNSSTYMNIEGKVQFLEKSTFKRSLNIKIDSKILKSLINFNAMNYCNKELKYYSYYKKNLQKSYFENNKNIFENTIKPSYHFSKEVLINLFIINIFKDSMCNSSTILKTYNNDFKNYTIYNKKLNNFLSIKKQDFLFENTLKYSINI
jgi:NADH-ubiquinone oxidoreductase chain 5